MLYAVAGVSVDNKMTTKLAPSDGVGSQHRTSHFRCIRFANIHVQPCAVDGFIFTLAVPFDKQFIILREMFMNEARP